MIKILAFQWIAQSDRDRPAFDHPRAIEMGRSNRFVSGYREPVSAPAALRSASAYDQGLEIRERA